MGILQCIVLSHVFLAYGSAFSWGAGNLNDRRSASPADPGIINAPQPRFLSRGQTFRVVIGDTLVLPCEVENLGSYVVLWRRGSAVLTASTLMVIRDPRFRLVDGLNLEVHKVVPQDAGDYVCQISASDTPDQVHTVEILVPPTIRSSPANGQVTVRKGGSITLECKASGNPVPTITWTRKDDTLPSGEESVEGFSISLDRVDRHQAGVYRCMANNGVGDPVFVDLTLDVLYPPEIEVERSWVHSGEGFEAQLVCIVHGEPPPETKWYQDSFAVEATERRGVETRGNKHTLAIRRVTPSDFGNYSCVADNALGRAKKYMELSGRPSPAEFRSAPFSRARHSYNLTWVVDSYPPLEEVRLLYRKLQMNETFQQPGRWHDVQLNPESLAVVGGGGLGGGGGGGGGGPEGFSHAMWFNIRGLEAGSVYEALVQAKNRYGWNEVSDLYQFYTRGSEEMDSEDWDLVAAGGRAAAGRGWRHQPLPVAILLLFCASLLAVSQALKPLAPISWLQPS
ncbi:lachesin-like isoform X2 [Ischnura elegans]|uniref:lachesin-like isoform X2 n=1 Tax=Ischnura elegans TaxID=197161 RepID=UPI001ED8B54A|nr:lachesin-like isoform X2 [Ischnura elegans]